MKIIKQFIKVSLWAISLLLFTTCKKETKITENPNQFGTLYGSGEQMELAGVLPISNNCYLLYGSIYGSNNQTDGFVMKVDENFTTLWYKTLGGFKSDVIASVAVDKDENIMAVGNSNSYPESADTSNTLVGTLFYTVFLDKNGNKLWQKSIRPNPKAAETYFSYLSHVFCTKDNTFFFVGNTLNFFISLNGNSWHNQDVLTIGMDKQGNQLWTKRIYFTPIQSEPSLNHCPTYDASVCDDGDILLLMGRPYYPKSKINLIKLPYTSTGNTTNTYTWKSADMENLFDPYTENSCEMKVLSGNKAVITDLINEGYAITDDNGTITKRVKFKREFISPKVTKNKTGAIITGYYETDDKKYMGCWALVDNEGNLIKEVYTTFTNKYKYGVIFKSAFLTSNNEVIVFGTQNKIVIYADQANLSSNGILMLRYDLDGNLIK